MVGFGKTRYQWIPYDKEQILYFIKKIGNRAAHTEFDNIWLFSGSTNGKWLS